MIPLCKNVQTKLHVLNRLPCYFEKELAKMTLALLEETLKRLMDSWNHPVNQLRWLKHCNLSALHLYIYIQYMINICIYIYITWHLPIGTVLPMIWNTDWHVVLSVQVQCSWWTVGSWFLGRNFSRGTNMKSLTSFLYLQGWHCNL